MILYVDILILKSKIDINEKNSQEEYVRNESAFKEYKAISMMRGKSPPSDVEMSKTLNLNLDLWRPAWIDNGYFLSLYSIYGNNNVYQFGTFITR